MHWTNSITDLNEGNYKETKCVEGIGNYTSINFLDDREMRVARHWLHPYGERTLLKPILDLTAEHAKTKFDHFTVNGDQPKTQN